MIFVYIALAAFVGGVVNALLGWTQTNDSFDARKFANSAIASFLGAIAIAVAANYAGAEGQDLISLLTILGVAFLSGAGVSSGVSRIAGSMEK